MSFKTILTIASPAGGLDDVELAAGLAEDAGAHLSVLVIEPAVPPPMNDFAGAASQVWVQQRQEQAEGLEACLRQVTEAIGRRICSCDVIDEFPELSAADDAVARRARYADLSIIGPRLLDLDDLRDKVFEGLLFASGRPVLVVPPGVRPTLCPRRVMVAWDGRQEASRAVREALDILVAAEDVRLVLVDPVESAGGHGAEPGADLATWLARHGVRVTVDRLPSQGRGVAATLERQATDTSAEMIVMGAYGHSRLRERIFGGVTRSFLARPPIPLFLAR